MGKTEKRLGRNRQYIERLTSEKQVVTMIQCELKIGASYILENTAQEFLPDHRKRSDYEGSFLVVTAGMLPSYFFNTKAASSFFYVHRQLMPRIFMVEEMKGELGTDVRNQ